MGNCWVTDASSSINCAVLSFCRWSEFASAMRCREKVQSEDSDGTKWGDVRNGCQATRAGDLKLPMAWDLGRRLMLDA